MKKFALVLMVVAVCCIAAISLIGNLYVSSVLIGTVILFLGVFLVKNIDKGFVKRTIEFFDC